MARLVQNSFAASDSAQMTLSFWFKITDPALDWSGAPDTPIPLIEWGDFTDDTVLLGSGLYWLPRPAYVPFSLIGDDDNSYPGWFFQVLGQTGATDTTSCLTGTYDNNPFSPWTSAGTGPGAAPGAGMWGHGEAYWAVSNGSFTSCFQSSGLAGSAIGPPYLTKNVWHHIMLAVDTNHESVGEFHPTDVVTGPKFIIFIDGVDVSPVNKDGGYNNPSILMPNLDAGTAFYAPIIGEDYPDFESGNGEETFGWSTVPGLTLGTYPKAGVGGGIFSYATDDHGGENTLTFEDDIVLTIPGFDIAFAGKKIGVPGFHNPNKKVQISDLQMYVDRFLDPNTYFSKFVKVTGSVGTPVDPAVTARTFGKQTLLFQGGASSGGFRVNKGTAGPFILTGAITDQTGPQYG